MRGAMLTSTARSFPPWTASLRLAALRMQPPQSVRWTFAPSAESGGSRGAGALRIVRSARRVEDSRSTGEERASF